MRITLIGLGKMGSALAKRLLSADFELTVFNRTKEKTQPLIEAGAKGADSFKTAVKNADVVITCLLDDHAVLDVVDRFIKNMKQGSIHIGTSTILPETSKKLDEIHQENNSIYIAGNVLGIPKVAEKGKLTSIIAGNNDALNKCHAIFESYSENIINAGNKPYQANVVKICMNYLLISAIETMGEIYAFAEKNEVDVNLVQKLFNTVFAHPSFKLYVDKIRERDFAEANFDVKGGFKDISLFQQAFANVNIVSDIANVIKNKFIIALAHQMDDKDWSSITEITRKQANMK